MLVLPPERTYSLLPPDQVALERICLPVKGAQSRASLGAPWLERHGC